MSLRCLLFFEENWTLNRGGGQANNETNTGFVIWPAAQILAHHLVNKSSHLVLGTDDDIEGDILELGAGSFGGVPSICFGSSLCQATSLPFVLSPGCGLVGLTIGKRLSQNLLVAHIHSTPSYYLDLPQPRCWNRIQKTSSS